MSTEEKIKIADKVMKKMSAALGVEFTPEQKQFNRGYLIAMMDAAEHGVQLTDDGLRILDGVSTPAAIVN